MWFSAVVKMDRIRPFIFERKTATKWYKTNIAIFGDTYKPGTFHDPASEASGWDYYDENENLMELVVVSRCCMLRAKQRETRTINKSPATILNLESLT